MIPFPKPSGDALWNSWAGGENPLPAGARVVIQMRNGKVFPLAPLGEKGLAAAFLKWAHGSERSETDIVAYRVVSLPASAALSVRRAAA